jgi:hypothetical protein
MNPNEQNMWREIADIIEPYCINGAGYIRDYYEDEHCKGFTMRINASGNLYLIAKGIKTEGDVFLIEDDIRQYVFQKSLAEERKGHYDPNTLNYVDPPGTFEGLSDEADA